MELQNLLKSLGACKEAVEWTKNYSSLDDAWAACPRVDWMLWLWGKYAHIPDREAHQRYVGCCAACVRGLLELYETHRPEDKQVRRYLDGCESYGRGEVKFDDLELLHNQVIDAINETAFETPTHETQMAGNAIILISKCTQGLKHGVWYSIYYMREVHNYNDLDGPSASTVRKWMPTPSFVS